MTVPEQTIPGVDPTVGAVPPRVLAEFTPSTQLPASEAEELARLEREIQARVEGRVPAQPAPAPSAPSQVAPPAPSAPPAAVIPPAAPPAPLDLPPPVLEATAPQSAPAAVPVPPGVNVPAKFLNPDGTLATDKLFKSLGEAEKRTLSPAEALQRYAEMERTIGRGPQPQAPMPGYVPMPGGYVPGMPMPGYVPAPAAPGAPLPGQMAPPPMMPYLSPDQAFEAQVRADMQRDPVGTQLALIQASQEANRAAVETQLRDIRMREELMQIAQQDPSVFTQEGFEKLAQVRQQNPWLQSSPTPWLHAYRLAQTSMSVTPTSHQQPAAPPAAPVGNRPAAPVAPGVQPPAPQAASQLPTTEAEIRAYAQQKFGHLPLEQRAKAESELYERLFNRMRAGQG